MSWKTILCRGYVRLGVLSGILAGIGRFEIRCGLLLNFGWERSVGGGENWCSNRSTADLAKYLVI